MTVLKGRKLIGCCAALLLSLSVAVLWVGSTSAAAQPVIKYKISHTHPDGQTYSIFAKKFMESFEKKTGGSVVGTEYPEGVLGSERANAEGLLAGTIEVTFITSAALCNWAPKLQVLDLPFLYNSREIAQAKIDGPLGGEMVKALDAVGFKSILFSDLGGRFFTTSKLPIYKVSDLAGLKMRTMESTIQLATYTLMGANPTPLPATELFLALQQKTVDGMDMILSLIWGQKFHEVQNYMTLSNHFYAFYTMIVNPAFWNKLSPEQQTALVEAAEEAKLHTRAEVTRIDAEYLTLLETQSKLKIVYPEEIDYESFKTAVAPIYEQFEPEIGAELLSLARE